MNWKDVPNLFANGKFSVHGNEAIETAIWQIIGYDQESNQFKIKYNPESYYSKVTIKDGLKLYARPISDMSDEEIKTYNDFWKTRYNCRWGKEDMVLWTEKDHTGDTFLYLLTIGVYPFNQDNPKDVIWRYENVRN